MSKKADFQFITIDKAKRILGNAVKDNGEIDQLADYISWTPGDNLAILDGDFSADELSAIAAWMRMQNCAKDDQNDQNEC